jgi:molybdenum cofactor cytidylyltransferase
MLVFHMRMIASPQPLVRMVVLAAGLSTRLGSPKALARVRGTSLIRNTVRLLTPLGTSPIIVVIPARAVRVRAELRGLPVRFVENPRRAQGLSTSVRCGLAAAYPSAAVLLLPVDLARLNRRDLARLLSRWRGSRRRLVATRFGRHGGAPLIVPRWLCARALAISGDRGLRELVGGLPAEERTLLELPTAAADVDTPQDLERARRRSSR